MENANDSIILDLILVVGGYDGGQKDTVELLSLTSKTKSGRLEKFPKKISNAVGTTLGESVIHIQRV